jgi:hypothetical protein
MSRIAKGLAVVGLALALAGLSACEPVQNPNGTGAGNASKVGSSNNYDSTSSTLPVSSSGTVAGGTIDSPQSQGLSDYLKHHSLPLVGAQVVTSASGGKQVILFGFVASDFGKTDAEQKARHYLKDSSLVVDNRIKISPELAGGSGGSSQSTVNGVPSNAMPTDGSDPYATSGSVQDYQNNMPPDAQAYAAQGQQMQQMQQYQQYNSGASPSMLSMILPLLLGGGGSGLSIGGGSGGFGGGGGFGGFSSGYAPSYGGYGYPTYPPPIPNSGFGASGAPGTF